MNYRPNKLKKTLHSIRRLAAKQWFRAIRPRLTIAITGSQGKTNTTHLLSALFPGALVTDTNLDTIYNVPITVLKLRPGQNTAIFELGIDSSGEMTKHLEIVKPNIAIITGIATVHTDAEHLGSLENLIKEKRKIIECLNSKDFAILNRDDLNVRRMAQFTKARVIWYGTDPKTCDFWVAGKKSDVSGEIIPHINKLNSEGINFNLHHQDRVFNVQGKLLGSFFAYNYLAVFATLAIANRYFSDQPLSQAELELFFQNNISKAEPLPGRMSLEQITGGITILNDSLRANISSTKAGLTTLHDLEYSGKKIAVLGEMGEIGKNEVEVHKELGRFLTRLDLDLVIGVGKLQEYTIDEAQHLDPGKIYFPAPNVIEAAEIIRERVKPGDILYLKASLLRHLERILLLLDGTRVGCNVVVCPLYNHCSKCKFLASGYI